MEHTSIWRKTSKIEKAGKLLEGRRADVAVIGAGIAGILTAHRLQKMGHSVIVLEAGTVGGGVTQNTTAKITAQHGLCYDKMIHSLGMGRAQQYATLNMEAVEEFERVINAEGISCDFERKSAFLFSRRDREVIEKEVFAARTSGIPAKFTTETALPFPIQGAEEFLGQAQFHPLKFLGALSRAMEVYEHTPVLSLDGNTLLTPQGRVTADQIVVATHYPFLRFPGLYFLRMHQARSYVIALKNAGMLDGMYIEETDSGVSMRNFGQYLLLGGQGHRTGEAPLKNPYQALEEMAARWYPGCEVLARWSAQDCMPLDGVPYIGRLSPSMPHVFVETGFHKWGMTGAMCASILLCEQMAGRRHPCEEVFSPRRITPAASAKPFLMEAGKSVKNIAASFLAIPRDKVAHILPGQSGEVWLNGQRAGVYRDETGTVFAVSLRCPHLGCKLSFNPAEKTWDCPCHGSRFTYRGDLLENPAQSGVKLGQPSKE